MSENEIEGEKKNLLCWHQFRGMSFVDRTAKKSESLEYQYLIIGQK